MILDLLQTDPGYNFENIAEEHVVKLLTPEIKELEKVSRKRLLNVGLLHITALKEDGEQILSINMVVHVKKDSNDDSQLIKTVLNPME
mmetsp:Transcript_16794/g.12003  ORF Transcript_16794/g.12003 Transcript_16794/m.12003 type:complete len:88 (+) Transcript_16794:198-461(+)